MGRGAHYAAVSAGKRAQKACWRALLLGLLLGLALVLPKTHCQNEEAGQGYSDWEDGLEADERHEYDGEDGVAQEELWDQAEEGSDEFLASSGDFSSAGDEAGDEQYSQDEPQWEDAEGSAGGSGGQAAPAFLSAEEMAEERELQMEEERGGRAHPRSFPGRPSRQLSSHQEDDHLEDGILFLGDVQGIWLEAMGASLVVSLCSILCLVLLPLLARKLQPGMQLSEEDGRKQTRLNAISAKVPRFGSFRAKFLVSASDKGQVSRPVVDMLAAFGVGAMLGDAFLHQLPHALSAHSHGQSHEHGHGHAETPKEHSHGGGGAENHFHSAGDLAVGISVLVGVVAFFLVEKLVRWVEEQAGAEDDDAEERQLAEKVAQVKRQREAAAGGGGVRDKTSLRPGEEGEEGEALLGQGKGAEAVEDKGTEAQWDRPTPGQGQAVGASRGEAAEDEGPESEEDEGGWEPLEGPGPELAPVAEAKGAAEGASSKGSGATEGEPAVGTGAAGVAGKDGTGAVRRTAAGVVSSEKRSSHGVTGSTGAGEGASGEGAPKAEASQAQDDAGWRAPGGSVSWSPSSSSVAGYLNLFSDAIHNFTDGLSLGAAFLHRGSLGGYSRMLFMLAHEIPQEIGDFGILVRSGMAVLQALALNFVSALMAVAGTAVALSLGSDPANSSLVEGFTAGGFIYISLAGVLPDMQSQKAGPGLALLHTLSLCAGMGTALAICLIE